MPSSTQYKNQYISEKYDRINLTVPKGQKEQIAERAAAQGLSVNSYINNLIKADMEGPKTKKKEMDYYLF